MTDKNEKDIITLEFDDGEEGEELECEIIGVFEFQDKEYIALAPDDETNDVYIYGYSEPKEDEFEILDIEDDEEFKKVAEEFDRIMCTEE